MTRRTLRRTAISAAAALLVGTVVMTAPTAAQAASPGKNGRIIFEVRGSIISVKSDGTGPKTLTPGPNDHAPHWSPDGKTIAFERAGDLWLMHADGTHQTQLTSGPGIDTTPAWSPDGKKIVFVRSDDGSLAGQSMFVKPVAGGLPTRLTSADDGCAYAPTWASTGRYVVFSDECQRTLLKVDTTNGSISTIIGTAGVAGPGGQWLYEGTSPDVSPDGTRVAVNFEQPPSYNPCEIADVTLSGTGLRDLASSGDCGAFMSDDPAYSPDGKRLVWAGGDDSPQLDLVLLKNPPVKVGGIWNGIDFPLNPDWQPKP